MLDFARLGISPDVGNRWVKAEEAIYANPDDPMTNWDIEDLRSWFEQADLTVTMDVENTLSPIQISSATIDRWFGQNESKPTYANYLSRFLSEPELGIVQQAIGSTNNSNVQLHAFDIANDKAAFRHSWKP